ncbi:hypothetical protein CRG98_002243 [Punica granatum]|uniref:BHLH domain-containing protein n=1 Tax=Punica granatum TaxID=22663 RepID=A0A2I0L9B8_PUNGR|nr:hypothetical protein CRG98_002243 [Punica granatum]
MVWLIEPCSPNNDLVELLWRNGQVVMHSQTHRRPSPDHLETQQLPQKHENQHHQNPTQRAGVGGNTNMSYGNSSILIQDDETVSWIHYPVDDSFEKEFCSPFFTELPAADAMETDKLILAAPEQASNRQSFDPDSSRVPNPMLPPQPQVQFPDSAVQKNHGSAKVNFSQFLGPIKGDLRHSNPHFGGAGDVGECSGMTVGSSNCGSNQVVLNDPDFSRASSNGTGTVGLCSQLFAEDNIPKTVPQDEGRKTETLEPTVTSSSGGSGSSFGGTQKNSAGTSSLKRKGRDVEDSECQSDAAELESGGGKKPSQRSGSARRSRAAEVHNQSERRRRDKINKKMRALQELIPHCNKTDKASMLDEAIEYLKSLQLQLQMMWMGSGMAAPMMFPGMQPYMSPMGIGMGPHPLAAVHNNMHLPRVPMVDHQSTSMAPPNQNMMCQAPVLNPVNFQNQMQMQNLPEQFVRYMGMHQLQAAASQPVNMFRFGPQTMQNSQVTAVPGTGIVQLGGGASNDDASRGKIG